KDSLTEPGRWSIYMMMQGETVPIYENHVRLSNTEKDAWGIPQLVTAIGYTENDDKMVEDFLKEGEAMLKQAGCSDIRGVDNYQNPGLDIHEVGGVRMGKDPNTSL